MRIALRKRVGDMSGEDEDIVIDTAGASANEDAGPKGDDLSPIMDAVVNGGILFLNFFFFFKYLSV